MLNGKEIEAAFDLRISKMTRVRDVYRILSDKRRVFCCKSYQIPEQEARFIAQVLEHLANRGFRYAPRITPTRSQTLWTTESGTQYMLTNWIRGRSPNFHRRSEFHKSIRTLARFHQHAEGIQLQDVPVARNRYHSLVSLVQSYRDTFVHYEAVGDMSPFTSLCDSAIHYLNQPKSQEAIRYEQALGAFVHGDYNYPNLILDANGAIQLIDFENTSMQARMTDLAHILHRNCEWKGKETVRWIEAYDRIRPLSSIDRYLLYALLHVPYPLIRSIRRNKKANLIRHAMPSTKTINKYVHDLEKIL